MRKAALGLLCITAFALGAAATPIPTETPLPGTGEYVPANPTPEVAASLAKLNRARRLAGVSPVLLDGRLSEGCRLHAHYLAANLNRPDVIGLGAHRESADLPGFTIAGRRAAATSDIVFYSNVRAAVETCLSTLYHRIPMLRPNLHRVGIGSDGGVVLIDVISGLSGSEDRPVAYPAPEQADVPTGLPDEIPDPLPPAAPHPGGFPITLQFSNTGTPVAAVHAELADERGAAVPFYLSDPGRPACHFPQQNTICLIPKRPLRPGMSYRVTIAANTASGEVRRSWSFRTERQVRSADAEDETPAPDTSERLASDDTPSLDAE